MGASAEKVKVLCENTNTLWTTLPRSCERLKPQPLRGPCNTGEQAESPVLKNSQFIRTKVLLCMFFPDLYSAGDPLILD